MNLTEADSNRDGIAISSAVDTLPKSMLDKAPSIDKLRKRFDEARSDTNEARPKSQRDRDYYDGPKQLSSEVRTILKARAQPPIYTNRIRPAVNGVLGVLEAGRQDPRAYPRNPGDEQAADVCTKTLRYIADTCKFQDTRQDVAENFLIEGTGAVIVEMDGDKIIATQIRWEEFYFDPYARRSDLKDARYMGVAKWVDASMLRERYGDRINEIGDPMMTPGINDTFDDRPFGGQAWVDRRRRRTLLIEEYSVEDGQWMRSVYTASGVLEFDVSPYLDDKRRPCNPIEAVSCYVDRDNSRYGMVRDMIPIQDEVNASRSRSLHLMNSRQVQQTDVNAPPVDSDIARIEAAKADGVIPAGWGIVSTNEATIANLQRMQEAKSEIERMGPTPAVLGRQEGAGQSGRARLVSQQAGLTEIARPLGRLSGWALRVYEQMFQRAQQFWTDPMWIRVTDELRAPEFLQVNEPVMGMVMQPQPVVGPDGQPVIGPDGQPVMQMVPGVGVTGYNNRLAEMNMDIILDEVPDTANLAQEVWAELMQLVSNAGGLAAIFTPEFEIAIEMSPMADKARIIERLKARREEQQKAQAEAAQQQQAAMAQQAELAAADAQSKIAERVAKTEATEARTLIETQNHIAPNDGLADEPQG